MKRVLMTAIIAMLLLLVGIFLLVSGSLTVNAVSGYLGFATIAVALAILGWSVVTSNREL